MKCTILSAVALLLLAAPGFSSEVPVPRSVDAVRWCDLKLAEVDPILSNPMRMCIVGCNDVVSSVYVNSPLLSFIHSQESSAVSVPSRRLPINLATSLVS